MNKDYFVGFKTASGTKVFVNVNRKKNRRIGLTLYQPYSVKGKLVGFAIKYLNPLALKLLSNLEVVIPESLVALHNQEIINLENASFMVSATGVKTVIVSRIRGETLIVKLSNDSEIIQNEIVARQHVQEFMLTPKLRDHGFVLGHPYIAFEYIEGFSRKVHLKDMLHFIDLLKRREEFIFLNHPRVSDIMLRLLEYKCPLNPSYKSKLTTCDLKVKLVMEHGDFTPWNVRTDSKGDLYLYDWENFVFDGLEYFDEIHFLFTSSVFLRNNMDAFVRATIQRNIPEIIVELYLLNRYYILKSPNHRVNSIIFEYLSYKSVVNVS